MHGKNLHFLYPIPLNPEPAARSRIRRMSGHSPSKPVSDVISFQPPKSSLLPFSCPAVKRKKQNVDLETDQRPQCMNVFPFQKSELRTPPSARNAAPFVAEESGLARKATSGATSSGLAKRCKSELGLTVRKNSFSTSAAVMFFVFAISATNLSTPSERVGPASTELTVTLVPAVVSASPRASATCIVFVTP